MPDWYPCTAPPPWLGPPTPDEVLKVDYGGPYLDSQWGLLHELGHNHQVGFRPFWRLRCGRLTQVNLNSKHGPSLSMNVAH